MWPLASRCAVSLVAIAEKIASPSAPPTCWEEFMIAATTPGCLVVAPVLAAAVTPTNTGPTPNATSIMPGRMFGR